MFKISDRVSLSLPLTAIAILVLGCAVDSTDPVSSGAVRSFDIVPQSSSYLIDTGPGPSSGGGSAMFASGSTHCSPNPPCGTYFQLLSGKVILSGNSHIESVEGWISAAWGGNVTAHVRTDSTTAAGPHIPGHSLGSATVSVPASVTAWRVFSGLSIDVSAGTYWVTFEPVASGGFDGGMPGPASNALTGYAHFNDGNNRWVNFTTNPALGVRVFGSVTVTAGDLITDLRTYVAGAGLARAVAKKIDQNLQAALDAFNANQTANACSSMQTVINFTQSQSVKKIPAATQTEIINRSNAIRTQLGC